MITEDEAAKLIAMKIDASKNRNYGYYRVFALRNIGGSRKPVPKINEKLQGVIFLSKIFQYKKSAFSIKKISFFLQHNFMQKIVCY